MNLARLTDPLFLLRELALFTLCVTVGTGLAAMVTDTAVTFSLWEWGAFGYSVTAGWRLAGSPS